MQDGSRVTIRIEHKPKSEINENKKVGAFYYIVQCFDPEPSSTNQTRKQHGNSEPLRRHINFYFYDQKGYSLLNLYTGGYGTVSVSADKEGVSSDGCDRIDGGWEWKGKFDERYITVENFSDIHSMKIILY